MQIGTLSRHQDETPRRDVEGDTETPSGELPRATHREAERRIAKRRHQDAERQIAEGDTKTPSGELPRVTPRRQGITEGDTERARATLTAGQLDALTKWKMPKTGSAFSET